MRNEKAFFKLPVCMLVEGALHYLMFLASVADFSLNFFLVINVDFFLCQIIHLQKLSAIKCYNLLVFLEYGEQASGGVHLKVLCIWKTVLEHCCPKQDFQILELMIYFVHLHEVN